MVASEPIIVKVVLRWQERYVFLCVLCSILVYVVASSPVRWSLIAMSSFVLGTGGAFFDDCWWRKVIVVRISTLDSEGVKAFTFRKRWTSLCCLRFQLCWRTTRLSRRKVIINSLILNLSRFNHFQFFYFWWEDLPLFGWACFGKLGWWNWPFDILQPSQCNLLCVAHVYLVVIVTHAQVACHAVDVVCLLDNQNFGRFFNLVCGIVSIPCSLSPQLMQTLGLYLFNLFIL